MAGAKNLCISYIDGEYHYLEVDRKAFGFFPGHPQKTTSLDALHSICRKSGEIYISSSFPSAVYQRELFPRVSKRHLPALVTQDAKEKMNTVQPVVSGFTPVQDISEAGVTKKQIAYCAVLESEVHSLWESFREFRRKVKFLNPLPQGMASMISSLDNPGQTFAAIWVGESNTIMLIASAQGTVYVARSMPLHLQKRLLDLEGARPEPSEAAGAEQEEIEVDMERLFQESSDSESSPASPEPPAKESGQPASSQQQADMQAAQDFSRQLERELDRTTTFFKQEFREPAPSLVYLLGNPNLQKINQQHPLPAAYQDVRYSLSTENQRGLSPEFASENLHILGNLFASEAYNFLPAQETVKRKSNLFLNAALILLLAGLGMAWLWVDQAHQARSQALQNHQQKITKLQQAQSRVASLEADVNQLKPLQGWYEFYTRTIADKPPWNMFISELAKLVDDDVILSSFSVPEGNGEARDCRLQGKIKAENWESGLTVFREFGKRVQSSPIFEVSDINYSPEGVQDDPSRFDFQMDLKLTARGEI